MNIVNDEFGYLITGSASSKPRIVLAHGAGAPMDTPFMELIANGLASAGFMVVRFEFPYMRARRTTGKRRGSGAAKALVGFFTQIIDDLGDPENLVIGGKSMGGRVASMAADSAGVAGLLCLGYPFHPAGKPDILRTEHLENLKTKTLIIQGSRDSLGSRDEIATYHLSKSISTIFLEDGEHSFKPRKSSGFTFDGHMATAIGEIARFADGFDSKTRK